MRFSLILLALVACHSDKAAPVTPAAAPTTIACGKVADHLIGMMPASVNAPQDAKDKVAGAMSQSCEEDAWSEDAKACLLNAASHDQAMQTCQNKLTQAQMDGVVRRMGGAHADAGGSPDAAPPPPPPAPVSTESAGPPPAPMVQPTAPPTNKKASKPKSADKASRGGATKPGKSNGDPCDGSE